MGNEELAARIAQKLAQYGEAQLTLAAAEKMAQAARNKAEELSVPITVAVVDAGANLILQQKMDGAILISIETAYRKAYTAAVLQLPTASLKEQTLPSGELYGLHTLSGGQYCVFGGGLPVFQNGRLLGAVGISGGSVQQDVAIAAAAVKVLEETGTLQGVRG